MLAFQAAPLTGLPLILLVGGSFYVRIGPTYLWGASGLSVGSSLFLRFHLETL